MEVALLRGIMLKYLQYWAFYPHSYFPAVFIRENPNMSFGKEERL